MPTRVSAAIFRLKAMALQVRRAVQDLRAGVRRWPVGKQGSFLVVLGESRTPLWDEADPAERALQQGKVQNLRCAVRRLNGAVVPAGGVFSFWKQIGQATRRGGWTWRWC